MSPRPDAAPERAPSPDEAELTHLRDEMRALMSLIPGMAIPGLSGPLTKADSLSDEDVVEAGFDNVPL
jgi:hypothetical protein